MAIKKVEQSEIVKEGKQIIIPAGMSYDTAIDNLERRKQYEEQFISMIDDFCRVVTKKGKNINFENDFLLQAHVMEAVRDSQRENRVVFLNEGMK